MCIVKFFFIAKDLLQYGHFAKMSFFPTSIGDECKSIETGIILSIENIKNHFYVFKKKFVIKPVVTIVLHQVAIQIHGKV